MLRKNFALAENVAKVGYVPYQGITQAALTPQMESGMRGIDSAAAAFGLPNAGGNLGMPTPTVNEAGFWGYSPYAQYQQEIAKIPRGQRNAIESFVIDPMTGMFDGKQGIADNPYGGPAVVASSSAYGPYPTYRGQDTRSGDQFGDPGSIGGYGQPGSLGQFGDTLGSIGNAFGDAFGGMGFGDPGSPAGTPSAAGAGAAEAAGFGGGDFGGW